MPDGVTTPRSTAARIARSRGLLGSVAAIFAAAGGLAATAKETTVVVICGVAAIGFAAYATVLWWRENRAADREEEAKLAEAEASKPSLSLELEGLTEKKVGRYECV